MKSIKLLLIFIAAVCLSLLFTSCGEQAEPPSSASPQATTPIITTTPPLASSEEATSPPAIASDSRTFTLPHDFAATDLYGNAVTAETLGEKQAFFVHLWATSCGPCVRGMPDLAELSRDYGDDVGFIGLVLDYGSNLDGAVKITEAAGIPDTFIMIDANEPSAEALRDLVRTGFVPASAIITKDNHSPAPLTGRNYAEQLDAVLG
jgi:thiol-disulfide isomerase/thioredoxin